MLNVNTLWMLGAIVVVLSGFLSMLLWWLVAQADESNTWRGIRVNIYNRTGDFPLSEWIEDQSTGEIYHVIVHNPKNMPTPAVVKAIKVQAKKDGFKVKAIGVKGVAIA